MLYKRGCDLILFDFMLDINEGNAEELIEFHFCDRHDFEDMVKRCAKSVFVEFYEDDAYSCVPYLVDYERDIKR